MNSEPTDTKILSSLPLNSHAISNTQQCKTDRQDTSDNENIHKNDEFQNLKTGILNQSSHIWNQYHHQTMGGEPNMEAIRRPQQATNYQSEIINTLINITNSGKEQNTIKAISHGLKQNEKTDLARANKSKPQ